MKLMEILDGNKKEKMFSCIYLWTNEINGKHYVGQALHFYDRMKSYKGKGATPKLQAAINKYGLENFNITIIEKCDVENLDEREQYWMDYYQSYESDKGYNIARYASTTRGFHHSDDTKLKISKASKKLWKDEEYRKFQSERMIGENNYFYGKHLLKEDNPMYGRHHSKETRKKISEKNKGNYNMGGCMPIQCIETEEIFISMSEAARKLNTYTSAIKLAVDNPNRTCKGFHFKKLN